MGVIEGAGPRKQAVGPFIGFSVLNRRNASPTGTPPLARVHGKPTVTRSARRDQLAEDADPLADLASAHVPEPDHQRGREEVTRRLAVGRDPVVAQSSYGDPCLACLSDDSRLIHPGRQPEQGVMTG